VRADAIELLGAAKDVKYTDLYLLTLNDRSYSVIENAAVALGETKNAKAYEAFVKLTNTPSWKGRIAAAGFKGLAALEDKRGLEFALKTATDKTQPVNVRGAALETIAATGKGDKRAFPLIFDSFKQALDANNFNGLSSSVQAIIKLADPRGQEAFDMLKEKFKNQPQILGFAIFLESQFKAVLPK
ncbi:MAG: hypothetical protein M3405_11505, partial [Acidobacteriota bacterium]|nr:hypothetical protein [Acidobacteriota bacterium]